MVWYSLICLLQNSHSATGVQVLPTVQKDKPASQVPKQPRSATRNFEVRPSK